jgi:hypothetical protein
MKRASLVVLLAVAVLAAAGCAGSAKQAAGNTVPSPRTGVGIAEKPKHLGLELSGVPVGYRPPISAHALLDRFKALHGYAGGRPDAHLWMVNGEYPAWVFTSGYPGGTFFGFYDLRGRRWTMSFRDPLHFGTSPCRGGLCGFPLNQGGLDMAAGYAERSAGVAPFFASDRVDDVGDHVILHLVHAPRSVIAALNARYPGTYVFHNNAIRTLSAVLTVEHALGFGALQSKGIAIVSAWPSDEGRLMVGVTKDIPGAQAYFDATYGRGFVRVVHGEPAMATDANGSTGNR